MQYVSRQTLYIRLFWAAVIEVDRHVEVDVGAGSSDK